MGCGRVDVFYGSGGIASAWLAAEETGQPRGHLFLGEELLGRGRLRRGVVVNLAIEQELRGVDEHADRGLAGVNGNELDAGALFVSEIDFHGSRLRLGGQGVSTELW